MKAPRSGCSSDVGSERGALDALSDEKEGEIAIVRGEFVEVVSLLIGLESDYRLVVQKDGEERKNKMMMRKDRVLGVSTPSHNLIECHADCKRQYLRSSDTWSGLCSSSTWHVHLPTQQA